MKKILLLLVVVAIAAAAWFKLKPAPSSATNSTTERKVLFYQSAMHPWIKSDKPGKCTICGMELSPVYEGDKPLSVDPGVVTLDSNTLNVINVATELATTQPLKRTLRVAGLIDENDTTHRFISAYVPGRIEKLAVNYIGAEVRQGEPMVHLYSPQLATAQREYLTLSQKNSSPELEPLLKAAAHRLERLGLTSSQIAKLKEQTNTAPTIEITAPVSGTVVQRFVYEGQYVMEGEKLFELADFSTLWFRFDAYEQDLPWLQIGQEVDVTVASAPGKIFSGKIGFIEPNIQDQSRSARVRVELPNPLVETNGSKKRQLYSKLYAEGLVRIATPQTLTVPRSAVLSPGSTPVVYVAQDDNTYQRREVKLGRAGDDRWEILDGLQLGEKIVTSGNLLIDSQAQLNISMSTAPMTQPDPSQKLPPLTPEQTDALDQLFKAAFQISRALAADDLKAFNDAANAVTPAIHQIHEKAAGHPVEMDVHMLTLVPLKQAADLDQARVQFYPFTRTLVPLAEKARRNFDPFKTLKVYKCPMAPKPGQTSFWIQKDAPLQNPFYGAEMLDCGSEVKL